MSLGNSLESDFNLAGIRGPGSGASEGRNSEKRKVLTGKERASESDFETELTVPGGDEVREIVGGGVTVGVASDRSEGHDGREETKRGGRGDSRIPGGNGARRISRTA